MRRDRRADAATDGTDQTETSRTTSVKHRFLNTASRFVDRYDALSVVDAAYWNLDAAYCSTRIAICGGAVDVQIGATTTQFGVSTRSEYRRAKRLGGERGVIEALLAELHGSETVWDIGACVGTYTCPVASVLTSGCVIGFEPEPTNRSRLRMNLDQNAVTTDWEISPVALSDHNGTCTLSSELVEAGAGHHYLSEGDGGLTVETKRGESLIDETGCSSPDVIKIDVQGAELDVLRGLDGVLEDVRSIYLEIHSKKCSRYGTTAEEIEAFLTASGFSITTLGEPTNRRSGVYFVRGRRYP